MFRIPPSSALATPQLRSPNRLAPVNLGTLVTHRQRTFIELRRNAWFRIGRRSALVLTGLLMSAACSGNSGNVSTAVTSSISTLETKAEAKMKDLRTLFETTSAAQATQGTWSCHSKNGETLSDLSDDRGRILLNRYARLFAAWNMETQRNDPGGGIYGVRYDLQIC